jgi:hypothetical protein
VSRPTKLPEFASDPFLASITEPSEARKDEGWTGSLVPPASEFNWLHSVTYDWLLHLRDDFIDTHMAAEHIVDELDPNVGQHKDINATSLTVVGGDITTDQRVVADGFEYDLDGNGVSIRHNYLSEFNVSHISGTTSNLSPSPTGLKRGVRLAASQSSVLVFEAGPDFDITSFSLLVFGEEGAPFDLSYTLVYLDTLTGQWVSHGSPAISSSSGVLPAAGYGGAVGYTFYSLFTLMPQDSPNFLNAGVNVNSVATRIYGLSVFNNAVDVINVCAHTIITRAATVENASFGSRVAPNP